MTLDWADRGVHKIFNMQFRALKPFSAVCPESCIRWLQQHTPRAANGSTALGDAQQHKHIRHRLIFPSTQDSPNSAAVGWNMSLQMEWDTPRCSTNIGAVHILENFSWQKYYVRSWTEISIFHFILCFFLKLESSWSTGTGLIRMNNYITNINPAINCPHTVKRLLKLH